MAFSRRAQIRRHGIMIAPRLLAGGAAAILLVAIAATTFLSSPESVEEGEHPASLDSWIEQLGRDLDRGDGSWGAFEQAWQRAMPFERVVLERIRGFLFERLQIELRSDGSATWTGGTGGWENPQGQVHTGRLLGHDYAELCWLAERLALPPRSGSWSVPVSHGTRTTIELVRRDGSTLVFTDYGGAAPPEVGALMAAVELAAKRVVWAPSATESEHGADDEHNR